jgi:hypothetical protein
VLPRPGLPASTIAANLDRLIQTAFNYGDPQGHWDVMADNYVAWANAVEQALRASFSDVPVQRIYTDRFWRVSMQQSSRLPAMLELEAHQLVDWLTDVRDQVQAMATRFSGARAIGVLDTNVLLHFKPLNRDSCAALAIWIKIRELEDIDVNLCSTLAPGKDLLIEQSNARPRTLSQLSAAGLLRVEFIDHAERYNQPRRPGPDDRGPVDFI